MDTLIVTVTVWVMVMVTFKTMVRVIDMVTVTV